MNIMLFTRKLHLFYILPLLMVPIYVWSQSIGNVNYYLFRELPPGQIVYIFSKLFGMISIFLLWFQICFGLLRKIDSSGTKKYLATHKRLGILTASVMLTHFSLFFTAVWLRKETFPTGLITTQFSDYYHTGLSFGQLSVFLLLPVIISGRNSIKSLSGKLNGLFHRLSIVIFIFSILHSYMIGSEARWIFMSYVYLVMLVSVLSLLIRRVYVR